MLAAHISGLLEYRTLAVEQTFAAAATVRVRTEAYLTLLCTQQTADALHSGVPQALEGPHYGCYWGRVRGR